MIKKKKIETITWQSFFLKRFTCLLERQRDRETDRQRDRETDGQTDRHKEREKEIFILCFSPKMVPNRLKLGARNSV